ncbi:MAG: c-type cytochrome [Caulobacteraceae bacterium]|nr:c-type cytochrome [Caulobacteraceae bacterium]
MAAVGACTPADRARHDPFTATGEIIALGGGDAGVGHACATCHGLSGEGDGGSTPRLAGLPAGYLVKQLQDYADGRRADPVMGPIARAMSPEARRMVSDYYAARPAVVASTAQGDEATLAARLYQQGSPGRSIPACDSCHGALGEGGGGGHPPVWGQPASYLALQLWRWRRGVRQNDSGKTMLLVSQRLTPTEIEALGLYMAGLSGPPAASGTAPSPP